MLRRMKIAPVAVVISAALMVAGGYFWVYSISGPTAEEFRVYSAFLSRKAADDHLQPNDFAIARTTLELFDPYFDSSIPTELRHDKTYPSAEFAAFCGFCARSFVRKNLTAWHFEPGPHDAFGISVVQASEPSLIPPKQNVAVSVTRVGFNLWHTRAVLGYSANCSDYSPDNPSVCIELGEVYLQKRHGVWKVEKYTDFLL